jgi:ABC-type Fe3+/spermidine/putrescine transport system ATPase subunit
MGAAVTGEGLSVRAVRVMFNSRRVLNGVDLDVAPGEIVALQGPSGAGKSTLLAVIAGLIAPDSGTVTLNGNDITGVAPHRRNISMVFQRPGLFAHLDVAGNVGFGLRMARSPRVPRQRVHERTGEVLELVDLVGFASRSVDTLSGGEAQRVSLARALAPHPSVLLLDEPLSALDAALRGRLADDVARILRREGCTTLYVTHDVAEAHRIADRVVELRQLQTTSTGHLAVPAE